MLQIKSPKLICHFLLQVKKDLLSHTCLCLGPAAENGVRSAILCGDEGHVASKNGMGAVFASKNLKGLVAVRGSDPIPFYKEALSKDLAEQLLEKALNYKVLGSSRP